MSYMAQDKVDFKSKWMPVMGAREGLGPVPATHHIHFFFFNSISGNRQYLTCVYHRNSYPKVAHPERGCVLLSLSI